ncbi:MAG: hypothetical protein A3C90_01220 [Candidatus Magasanikbacteria bacterium RIFCSPHIGHO2_02_FULL_51_14]|uniref:ECF transporter S component n=1 Tax=Candidatus Magasanikbacteria bacterium RIFCSPHIGHO2_02_FULL_51_14 TaxID=1798683 RepID=A0A1F6MQ28_9BACT|nr:MAG: hypothetical protein A3C90_01220 [Candidatus Magasanikbacteria bacterium RIFCSPHIGHO2_02_FULL_51_14]
MTQRTRHKLVFIILFSLLGFLAMQVPFSKLVGAENIRFSLFDFYGPIAGAFIGSLWGVATVVIMQLINWAVNGFAMDAGTMIRLFPMLFAVLYFARKSKLALLVPVAAMIAFWAHPEGRLAWYYALYWLIPIAMHFFRDRFLFARALGATFTAHSVGGALWIWTFNMKAAIWIGLIPIVWQERVLMAVGITVTYIAFNYLVSVIKAKTKWELAFIQLHAKYIMR